MKTAQLTSRTTLSLIFFDIIALAFIYFVPTISHLLNFPLYLVEPMRIALILALVHTTKRNAYIIAFTLPLFSFLVSAHPIFLKMLLITTELVLNVWLFYFIFSRSKNAFASILSSIVMSKGIYYLAKFAMISLAFMPASKLFATPLYIQLITAVALSAYLGFVFWRRK